MTDMINAYEVGLPLWLGVGHELMEALTSLPLAYGPVERWSWGRPLPAPLRVLGCSQFPQLGVQREPSEGQHRHQREVW